jgi:hypothetical protein
MSRYSLLNGIAATSLLLGTHVLGTHAALAESRLALVIGQSAYRSVVPLPNPANDAKAMSRLLGEAGFDVTSAADLSQNDLREQVGEFAAKVAARGSDTVALVFYAGHGLQIDGENYLVPVDVDPKREADVPLQAVRLNDVLNTLTSNPAAGCLPQQSIPGDQQERGPWARDRRRQDRISRHLHVVFDFAGRRSRRR